MISRCRKYGFAPDLAFYTIPFHNFCARGDVINLASAWALLLQMQLDGVPFDSGFYRTIFEAGACIYIVPQIPTHINISVSAHKSIQIAKVSYGFFKRLKLSSLPEEVQLRVQDDFSTLTCLCEGFSKYDLFPGRSWISR